jgi:hypothetical protein
MDKDNTIVGNYYKTTTNQLYKVIGLEIDAEKRTRVVYLVKSSNIQGKPFGPQGTKASRKLKKNFDKKCPMPLSAQEVVDLRQQGILLENE